MARIEYIDETCRDGAQSLWGMQLRPGHILPVAREIDDAGYRVVSLTGSSQMEVLLRFHRENPWKGLDRIREALPKSTLRCGKRSNGLLGMGVSNDAIIDLWIGTLAKHGIGSMWIYDCLHDVQKMRETAQIAHRHGIAPSVQLNFSESPVHTDEYYVTVMKELVKEPTLTSIILGDEAGVMSVERARTWIPLMKQHAGDTPLELHFHDNTGQAAINHITGVEAGVTILHTAVRHMANGVSMPCAQVSVDNMRRLGHDVAVDDSGLDRVSEHFAAVAEMERFPLGAPVEFNLATVQSQIPGGMTGTLRDQLQREGLLDRLPELLEEAIVVRREMGYPIMATPFSQLIGTQALINVVTGKRYSVVPDENIMYCAGWYGTPPAPVEDFVLERAFSTERGRQIRDGEPPQPTISEIRAEYGPRLSDEELLLRYLLNPTYVDAMYANEQPIVPIVPIKNFAWVQHLLKSEDGRAISATLGGVQVALRR